MPEAYIIDAVRSPVGRRNGGLAQIHPADLGAHAIGALMENVDVDPAAVDASTRSVRKPATSRARAGSSPVSPTKFRARPSTGSAARRNRPCTSRRKR